MSYLDVRAAGPCKRIAFQPKLPASADRNSPSLKVAVWVAVLFLSLPAAAMGARKQRSSPPAPPDPDYVFALATANRFLRAWQSDDLETGMVLLSDRVRHSQSPEQIEQFFAGSPDRAFEIARGKGNHGRYRFAVVLVTANGTRLRRRSSEISVVDTGKNDWVVDKLP